MDAGKAGNPKVMSKHKRALLQKYFATNAQIVWLFVKPQTMDLVRFTTWQDQVLVIFQ